MTRLSEKFPASPRVDRLRGLALEAVGDEEGAKRLYDVLLEGDPTNVVCMEEFFEGGFTLTD